MKHIVIATGIALCCTTALAESTWQCQNMIAKDVCDHKSCVELKNRDTSFKIKLDQKNVSICSHANCWRGAAVESIVNNVATYKVPHFQWKSADRIKQDAILVIHPQQNHLYLESAQGKSDLSCRIV